MESSVCWRPVDQGRHPLQARVHRPQDHAVTQHWLGLAPFADRGRRLSVACRIDPLRSCGFDPDCTVANRQGARFNPVPPTVSQGGCRAGRAGTGGPPHGPIVARSSARVPRLSHAALAGQADCGTVPEVSRGGGAERLAVRQRYRGRRDGLRMLVHLAHRDFQE